MNALAIVIGAGSGLSASIARALSERAYTVALVARDTSDLDELADEIGALRIDCDAADPDAVANLFARLDEQAGPLRIAVYNPSYRVKGPITELDAAEVKKSLEVSAFGAFLMAHHAAKRMLAGGSGTMLFTGASAGVKGFPQSAPFAMGKFALRGLCQSLARELHPENIHIVHVVVDGAIANVDREGRAPGANAPDDRLDPDAIAESYMNLLEQHRSAWAWEIELRPWVERF